ncbi:MmcQ/YjbR family DNA-binding protein [Actinoallomurus sp. CA-142502]|uniref:MmcQ/YjbR family DNA-binding protein n=1 Tax=Actinoallomurus sp. CA-142502 TaxID=3239885 RepID=UPI003D93B299
MVTIDDIRRLTSTLPRSEEHLIRDRVKFRVGKIVYAALSRDETTMGCGFPKEEREAMIAAEPEKFLMPRVSDQRFNWIDVRLDAISVEEMHELVLDAWRGVVPKRVAAEHASKTVREDA